eukprot:12800312-Alexandrium_andersonii.AAC.1
MQWNPTLAWPARNDNENLCASPSAEGYPMGACTRDMRAHSTKQRGTTQRNARQHNKSQANTQSATGTQNTASSVCAETLPLSQRARRRP